MSETITDPWVELLDLLLDALILGDGEWLFPALDLDDFPLKSEWMFPNLLPPWDRLEIPDGLDVRRKES